MKLILELSKFTKEMRIEYAILYKKIMKSVPYKNLLKDGWEDISTDIQKSHLTFKFKHNLIEDNKMKIEISYPKIRKERQSYYAKTRGIIADLTSKKFNGRGDIKFYKFALTYIKKNYIISNNNVLQSTDKKVQDQLFRTQKLVTGKERYYIKDMIKNLYEVDLYLPKVDKKKSPQTYKDLNNKRKELVKAIKDFYDNIIKTDGNIGIFDEFELYYPKDFKKYDMYMHVSKLNIFN